MESAKKKIRILVVEDNPHIRNLLHYLLRDTFDLELVDCVDDALLTAAQQHFDLFLLDINLGEQRTGIDLLKLLRQMPAYTATPAVACTVYTRRGDKERFLAAGFDNHVGKPFTDEALRGTLQAVLAKARPPQPTEMVVNRRQRSGLY